MSRVSVDAEALYQVLDALNGPGHLIRELIVIHDLHVRIPVMDGSDPIGTLINDYNASLKAEGSCK